MSDDPVFTKKQDNQSETLEDAAIDASTLEESPGQAGSEPGASTLEEPPVQADSEAGSSTSSGTGAAEEEKAKPSPAPAQALKGAWKQVENIGQTLGEALQGRGNVVMVRVNDETLQHLDMLVEAELARSRSEAAAMLITEGVKANTQVFDRIREITDQIAALRSQLRDSVQSAAGETEQKVEKNMDGES